MPVNSYGGSFIGFKAISEEARGVKPTVRRSSEPKVTAVAEPEKLIIELLTAEQIQLQEVQEPGSLDILVTVFFDDEQIVEIVVPCAGKKRMMLYISYVTIRVDEDGTRNLDLKGYGYTKPIELKDCRVVTNYKQEVIASDGSKPLEMKLSYTLTTATADEGDAIPEDRKGGTHRQIFYSEPVGGLDVTCGSDVPNSLEGNLSLGNYLNFLKHHYTLERSSIYQLSLDVIGYSGLNPKLNRAPWRALAVKNDKGDVVGRWTAVNDQGFEIVLRNGARYFFYMHYTKKEGDQYETDANRTQIGWVYESQNSRDQVVRRCAYAAKVDGARPTTATVVKLFSNDVKDKYRQIDRFITNGGVSHSAYNTRQLSPKKSKYPCDCTNKHPLTFEDQMPEAFEWHSKITIPIVNQKLCGSCYAIAARYVLQARFIVALERIKDRTPELNAALEELSHYTFDPSDATDCSVFNQGCRGGYPYLMGKHMREFGLITVKNAGDQCSLLGAQRRYFASDYGYVGGCYQCTACQGEELIMREVFANGPVATAIDASALPTDYDGATLTAGEAEANSGFCDVAQHPILTGWEYTSHAVVIVGWGQEELDGRTVKYWVCRNSWGANWGADGYFKIERGKNAFGVESEAVFVDPDLTRYGGRKTSELAARPTRQTNHCTSTAVTAPRQTGLPSPTEDCTQVRVVALVQHEQVEADGRQLAEVEQLQHLDHGRAYLEEDARVVGQQRLRLQLVLPAAEGPQPGEADQQAQPLAPVTIE
ncbi:cysteine proteinase [Babesia caballi]|uniref:Dipeptidyl peptidase 1 n=1 Tax=Babesia caballi TaxID=5871 RepID=A0AAV4LXZ9_BABCB|nr:cysteine proteinase [Babesia caballi]